MDFQATVNNEDAAEHQKDEGVDDRREERRKEELLDHMYEHTMNLPGQRKRTGRK